MESEGNIPSEPSLLYLNLYATFEEVLKIELPQCRNIAFTLEEWTSRAGHGYLSLTIQNLKCANSLLVVAVQKGRRMM